MMMMTTVTKGFTYVLENILTGGSSMVNGRDDVEETTKLLVSVVVNHYTGGLLGDIQRPSCTTTLLRVVDHVSELHNKLFNRYTFRVYELYMWLD